MYKRQENESLEQILNTLSLWYDVDVFFQSESAKQLVFTGYMKLSLIHISIIHNPELVIFDEPTNGLDPNQKMCIRDRYRFEL